MDIDNTNKAVEAIRKNLEGRTIKSVHFHADLDKGLTLEFTDSTVLTFTFRGEGNFSIRRNAVNQ